MLGMPGLAFLGCPPMLVVVVVGIRQGNRRRARATDHL